MSIAALLKGKKRHSYLSNNVMIVVLSYCDIISLPIGVWSSPSVNGSRPPPCAYFSLTMIDEEDAVMFGGYSEYSNRSVYFADVFILHLPTMVSGLLLHITYIVCIFRPYTRSMDTPAHTHT